MNITIDLTEHEADLLKKITFDPPQGDPIREKENGNAVVALMDSLPSRKAIPPVRIKWFTDPAHNIGLNRSLQQVFADNLLASGTKLFRHVHFLKYLRYFIYGPNLPSAMIQAMCSEVDNCGMVTSGDFNILVNCAKAETRKHGLDPKKAAEELYKLCLELDVCFLARPIRDAVYRMK